MSCSLTQEIEIRAYESDFTGYLSSYGIMVRLQEIAEDHATVLKCGRADMVDTLGIVWMLTHLHFEADRYPKTAERLTLKTWPTPIERLYMPRFYTMTDKNGDAIIRAKTNWVLFDIKNRKLLRSSALPVTYTADDVPPATAPLERLRRLDGETEPLCERTVAYSNCDMNAHLNNAWYSHFICDAYPKEFLEEYRMAAFDITFVKEAAIGQNIIMSVKKDGLCHYICGCCGNDLIFNSKVVWKKF